MVTKTITEESGQPSEPQKKSWTDQHWWVGWAALLVLLIVLAVLSMFFAWTAQRIDRLGWTPKDYIEIAEYEKQEQADKEANKEAVERVERAQRQEKQEMIREFRNTLEYKRAARDLLNRYWLLLPTIFVGGVVFCYVYARHRQLW